MSVITLKPPFYSVRRRGHGKRMNRVTDAGILPTRRLDASKASVEAGPIHSLIALNRL